MEGLIGRELGGYRVVRELGRGSMGVVYHAIQTTLQRDVALKVLAPNLAGDRELLERFLREARLAARLSHPNIVHIYDQGCERDFFFIAMEYVPGRSLRQLLDKEGRLSPQRAIEVAMQVCEALQYAHEMGVIHRDIKPDNILMNEGLGQIKVTDFGLAKGATSMTLTTPGAFLGSPHYMALEQLRGERVDGRADLYSLGRVLYRSLAGRAPFETTDFVSLVVSEINDEVPHLRQFAPEVPEELAAVVMKAQAKAKADRYQSAAEMLMALERLHKRQIWHPMPVTSEEPEEKPGRGSGTEPPYLAASPFQPDVRSGAYVGTTSLSAVAGATPEVAEVTARWPDTTRLWAALSYLGIMSIVVQILKRDGLIRTHASQALAIHLLRFAATGVVLAATEALTLADGVLLASVGIPVPGDRLFQSRLLPAGGIALFFWLLAVAGAVQAWRGHEWRIPLLGAIIPPSSREMISRPKLEALTAEERLREEQERQYWERMYNERRERFQEAILAAERERIRRERLQEIEERINQILASVPGINDRYAVGDVDADRFRALKALYNRELGELKEEARSLGGTFTVKEPKWLPDEGVVA